MLLRRKLRMTLALTVTLAAALLGATGGSVSTAHAEEKPPRERQLLFYNHAYGVVDRETADAVEHSGYLRKFADFEVRTTTGSDGYTWTGRYLKGRETYLEIFGVGDVPDTPLGGAGLAISTERDGDLATVLERLRDQGITDPVRFQQTRDFGDGVPVPWFDAVFTTDQYDTFGTWAMEYRPEYFADPRGKTEPASYPGDVGRERYLPDVYRDRLMRDVASVRLAVTSRDLDNTVPLLRAGGFVVRPTAGGGVVADRGGTTIRLDAVPRDRVGLRQFTFVLNKAVHKRHVERLGHSTLTVGPGPRAVWDFEERGRG
ncbi:MULTISPECIES: DUF5829 family protein [unclassified Streptomyces]|uniref:DUF5829 family protein n=1 Tax=unclassified Streptomyces TaxID=2593676 RepID=UPI001CBBA25C|nr:MULTISPECIES: DUF5829 family protein [unclassified Streptomyces]WPO74740.1 DUF5829 family protein [Streptomyces sp. KN37]